MAVDRDGNESDITTLEKTHQFHIPKAPEGLSLRPLDDFRTVDTIEQQSIASQNVENMSFEMDGKDDPFVEAIDPES